MIDAMFDDCMPESSRAALWEITGRPQRVTLLYRHRSAFYSLTPLGLNVSRRKIYHFLDDALVATVPSPRIDITRGTRQVARERHSLPRPLACMRHRPRRYSGSPIRVNPVKAGDTKLPV